MRDGPDDNPAEEMWAALFCSGAGQFDELICKGRTVLRRSSLFNNLIDGILFLAGNEKHPVGSPRGEQGIIVIGTVESHDRAGLEMKIMGDVAIVTFGFGDPDIGWHVVVVIEQNVDFNTTLGPAEFGPGEEVEAQRDSRRVKAEQFVFEAELAFAIAKPACSAELLDHGPKEFLKEFCRTIFVGIGEGGLVWGFANAEVF